MTPVAFTPYRQLLKRTREIALLTSSASMLTWDLETYAPAEAVNFRAEQLAYLGGAAHRKFTSGKVGDLIAQCEQHGFPADSAEAANVREWRRSYDRATKVPPRLVEKMERTRTHAREAWKRAREQSKFRLFQPHLQKVLGLSRQFAECWGFQESVYDALLEGYEPGAKTRELRALFAELRPALGAVLGPAREKSAALPENFLRGHYPVAAQQAFNRQVAAAIGFDFAAGRIDTTTHPFCETLGPRDCRLTTRYDESNFAQSLYGVLHEAGHGLYEQGLPGEQFGRPLGTAVSLGIHESQSRLWENHVGRDAVFWQHWHPVACEHLPDLRRFTPEQIHAGVNRVAPSFIRVEADQVTYDLHIMLRFELEVALVEGRLKVADVPARWNEEFEKLTGLKVTRDADGCLQDIHWSIGLLGYFPTYTLGNLNAAQLMHRARQERENLAAELARGEYGGLLGWLRARVHAHGSRYRPQELMTQATGEPTRSRHHLDYLRQKFVN
ncbi:MAG TPA: carboxypeptidase M32 [Verrucomicrobiota bacterium]|nr:carboxypeptidase M32 [Verrucomicrobiota bacterium]HNT14640.1 carboxypeptidase M32 [Verrucomicrobiota bacterium]